MNGNRSRAYDLDKPVSVFYVCLFMKQDIFLLGFFENVRQIYPGYKKAENKRYADLLRYINIAAYFFSALKSFLKPDILDRADPCYAYSTGKPYQRKYGLDIR